MAVTPSTMLPLGTQAPDFSLPDTDGNTVSLANFGKNPLLVVMFVCNHCPFVVHVKDQIAKLAADYQDRGVGFVAINANDVSTHPDDSPEKMGAFKAQSGWNFPYLFDDSQTVAQAYQAACTPDFFVFDGSRELIYRGRLDGSTPGNGKESTGADLRRALDRALEGDTVPEEEQIASQGCNIKWKSGNEPKYALT